jgi:Protein of unknown function (DUF3159)
VTAEGPEPDASAPDPALTGRARAALGVSDGVGIDRQMLDQAIGGWRGLIDSGLPVVVFLVVYSLNGQVLRPALIAALVTGGLIALVRILRRESLQQVIGGFFGVAISAFVAARTGRAENFFLVGFLTNVVYGAAFLVSILVRRPLIGLLVGGLRGDLAAWRTEPRLRRAARTTTWLWVAMFGLRLLVQLPLYFAGAVGTLGIARVVMGWPLFLLTAFLTYQILHPIIHELDARDRDGAESRDR